ncbi:MAG: DUF362 domain-containing protein [Planctomycetes bacterium]|nr:DUF362 domain-containing protein [Planctomycetota bacterium]
MQKDRTSPMDEKRITRRGFIHLMECLGAGALLGWNHPSNSNSHKPQKGKKFPKGLYRGRVVHIKEESSVSWDFGSDWYGYAVNQEVVDAMVEKGLMTLTGTVSVPDAWARLVPDYRSGRRFAIKVNFNNYHSTFPDPDPDINALIEPVNGVIRSLIQFGVAPERISVFDVTHGWHSGGMPRLAFINRCLYEGVHFVAYLGNSNPYSATEFVTFDPPGFPGIPDLPICNVLVESDYLINMPIPKEHSFTGVTLGFKNHMGSIARCQNMHPFYPFTYYYNPEYNPLIDLFKNRHFSGKLVLTVGDFLFGNWYDTIGVPPRWITFDDNAPKSLLFAADPVAIDSVMTDFLEMERLEQGIRLGEGALLAGTRDLFVLAQKEGIGVHEKGDPWKQPAGSGYEKIGYIYSGQL